VIRGHGNRGKAEIAIAALPFDALVGVRLDEAGVGFSLEGHDGLEQGNQEQSAVEIGVLRIGFIGFEDWERIRREVVGRGRGRRIATRMSCSVTALDKAD
jgi:hypothetical protein